MVNVVDKKIIFCTYCWNERRKLRSFKKCKDLNIHLKLKHDSKIKFQIANQIAIVVPRPKMA